MGHSYADLEIQAGGQARPECLIDSPNAAPSIIN
jgi:hypothetical protein